MTMDSLDGAPEGACTGGAPADPLVDALERLMAEVAPPGPGGRGAPAGALSSLAATRLALAVERAHGVRLPLEWLAAWPGAPELAARIRAAAPDGGSFPGAAAAASASAADECGGAEGRYEPFPLTPLQEAYRVGKEAGLSADAAGCHLYREFRVPALDVERLRRAWARVVARHEALRAVLTPDGRQRILPRAPEWAFPVHRCAAADFERAVDDARGRLSHRAYPAGEGPCFALEATCPGEGEGRVHLSLDGMFTDGHGVALLLDDLWRCYRDPECPLPEPAPGVGACVRMLEARRARPGHRAELDGWVERLRGLPAGPALGLLPAAAADRAEGVPCLRRRGMDAWLPAERWAALRGRAAALGVSPTALALAAFAEALARHGAPAPFSLVVTTTGRAWLPAGAAEVAGPFASTLVLPVEPTLDRPFAEGARALHRALWSALEHGAVSGVEALRELRARGLGPVPELPVVFTSLLDAAPVEAAPGPGGGAVVVLGQTAGVALDAQLWEEDGALRLHWDVAAARFAPGRAEALFAAFANALEALAAEGEEETRPLNPLQQAYCVARAAAPAGPWDGCQVYHAFHLRELDPARLEAAWLRLVAAYDPLRSTVTREGELRVRASAPAYWHVPVAELRGVAGAAAARAALRDEMAGRAFALGRWPQAELRATLDPGGGATVHCAIDLALADGMSIHTLFRELLRLYADPGAEPRPAAWSEQARERARLGALPERWVWAAAWGERVAALAPGPVLARGGDRRRVRRQARVAGWEALRRLAAARGASPDALLLAALAEALSPEFPAPFGLAVVRWTAAEARFRPAEATALTWVASGAPGVPLAERAAAYQRELDADPPAAAYGGLDELRRRVLRERRRGVAFAFPVVFTSVLDLSGLPLPEGVRAGEWLTCTPDVSLDCIAVAEGGALHCVWDAVEADFPAGVLDDAFARYVSAARALVDGAAALACSCAPAGAADAARTARDAAGGAGGAGGAAAGEERRRVLYAWNDTALPFPGHEPAHHAFEACVRARPHAVALRWAGGWWSYGELNRRANAIAWRLRRLGVGPETVVGISMRRGPGMVAAVFGVLKAGGAYLPVEPSLPAARAAVVLDEARCGVVLTTAATAGWPAPGGVRMEVVDGGVAGDADGDVEGEGDPPAAAGPWNTAYVIFTSGSTGRPKGVQVGHRAVLNLLHWCGRTFGFGPGDLGVCVTSLGFDLSVFDLLGLLGRGAAVYVADEDEQRDPALLLELLLREPVTFWNSAPTTLAQLAPLLERARGHAGAGRLRLVFLSGDYTPLSLPGDLRGAFPNARLVSLGGATEATVWSNWFPVERVDPAWQSIPYGRPIDNARYYVLGPDLEPCAVGVRGDLYIAGECVAMGYRNRPALTAGRFVPDPFGPHPGARMYRTGDLASWFPDGNLCFHGRDDTQLKVRGFRVEPGEIEHRLCAHPGVKEAVVVPRDDGAGGRALVAYVIPAAWPPPTVRELRAHAAGTLPDYMVPNFVGFVGSFPATSNGKLDRAALPWPLPAPALSPGDPPARDPSADSCLSHWSNGDPSAAGSVSHGPPAESTAAGSAAPLGGSAEARPSAVPQVDAVARELAEACAAALGVPSVNPDSDVWDQGATSFTMVQLSGVLRSRYGWQVPVSALLDHPTLAGIARAVVPPCDARAAADGFAAPASAQSPATPSETADGAGSASTPAFVPPSASPGSAGSSAPGGEIPPRARAEAGGPAGVEFFSPEARERFREAGWSRRAPGPGERRIALPRAPLAAEHYAWRASVREFLSGPVPHEAFCRWLGLLRRGPGGEGGRALYPSAGETYAVQLCVHVRPGGVEGLAPGTYAYDPAAHALELLEAGPGIDRSAHFYYNRPLFDRSAFGLYLVGQTRGIEPLYGADAERFLLLEAGYIGQLLMMGQAAHGIGVCPVGSVAFDPLRRALRLDEGHRFLHALLGGPAAYPPRAPSTGERPAFSRGAEAAAMPEAAVADADPGAMHPPDGARPLDPSAAEVAVTGMACRFPGADSPEAFWRNLEEGRCSIGPLPAARRAQAGADAPAGGWLPRVDRFHAARFRVSPEEARTLDPQLRLLLETVWACLEDAGHTPASLRRAAPRVGVFVGAMWSDYRQAAADAARAGAPARISATASDMASRVSHAFGVRGPSVAVDGACTSALAALHLAAASLRAGECDAAVVAAVSLVAHPYHLRVLAGLGLVAAGAPAGAFCGAAGGWSPGEGAGALLLRRVGDAERHGDAVQAVVEGTALGHAGGGGRFGAPDPAALAESIGAALAAAGVEPAQVGYVECAAAGAALADAAEVEALDRVFHGVEAPVPVGTVKPNVGHLEAAAGMTQLLKTILQLRHRRIAPTLLSPAPSPLVAWEGAAVRPADRAEPWEAGPGGAPPRALVNALGATGACAHAVVRASAGRAPAPARQGEQAILLSAPSPEALREAARRLRDRLDGARAGELELADVAFTLQTGRVAQPHRLAVVVEEPGALRAELDGWLRGDPASAVLTATVHATPVDTASAAEGDTAAARDAARAWLAGHAVEWDRRWTPPARRVALPGTVFGEGEAYWLEPGPSGSSAPAGETPASAASAGEAAASARTVDGAGEGDGGDAGWAEAWLTAVYAQVSGIPAERLHPRVPLEEYGLSSFLVARLNERLAREAAGIPRTLFYEHADLAGAAAYLAARHPGPWRAPAPPRSADHGARGEPAAIVGIAGRYPMAPDLDAFWEVLREGRDCVTPLPAGRPGQGWPAEGAWGGFLEGVDRFDPLFFGITPREAARMDPQERLFLEVVWEALEDAGCTRARLRARHGGRVGVFAGSMYNEYPFFGVERSLRGTPDYAGSALAGIANRVSYALDLSGPSLAVDTMCASALTALHLAVESLRRGECEAAIAGAVNLSLHPNKYVQQAALGMTAPGRRCRSFGAAGDGMVPGEGVGAVLLKPLSRALRDGDRVHAVILGTAVNHGGRTHGYMVPSPGAQGELVAQALRRAGVEPGSIGYLEAHGTGTGLGDPIEIAGLTRAFGPGVAPGSIPIGSVKSNLGHLEAAAGMAGLTRVVLQMRHGWLAPTLHAAELNPNVEWEASPFRVQREGAAWTARPRRAGVSAFGAGGANAHLVLEEYAAPAAPPGDDGAPQLLVLSARDEERLREMAARLAARLRGPGAPGLRAAAWTLQVGREPLRERLALVAATREAACAALERFAAGDAADVLRGRAPAAPPAQPARGADGVEPGADALAELAGHWLAGGEIAWERLHAGARPALVSLPAYPFARLRCWLPGGAADGGPGEDAASGPASPDVVRGAGGTDAAAPPSPDGVGPAGRAHAAGFAPAALSPDATRHAAEDGGPGGGDDGLEAGTPLDGDAGAVPLYEKRWVPAPPPRSAAGDDAGTAICVFAGGAEPLAREVAAGLGPRVLLVREGAARGDGVPAYQGEDDAARLMESLLGRNPELRGWIDLCALDRGPGEAPAVPWTARLGMLQRLVAARPGVPLRVLQAMPAPAAAPPPAALAGARIAGFVRALGAEWPRARATLLELDGAGSAAAALRAEWGALDPPPEAAYRHGRRHLAALVELAAPAAAPPRLDPGRVYLVSGGTRGLGALVARHLVRRGARRLALLGLHPLPPRDAWDGRSLPEAARRAVAGVRALEAAGARVLVHAGPLDDRAELERFLPRLRDTLGEVAGVVHCAGTPARGRPSFPHKRLDDVRAVFAPKAAGAELLAELLPARELSFFVLFSSVSAVAPALAAGVMEYAAANSFLDFFARARHAAGQPAFRAVHWPAWRESGAGQGGVEACARLGLGSLGDAQGLGVLDRVLALPAAPAVIPAPAAAADFDPRVLLELPRSAAPASPGVRGAAATADPASSPTAPPDLGSPSVSTAAPAGDGAAPPSTAAPVADGAASASTAADANVDAASSSTAAPPAWLVEIFSASLAIAARDLDPAVPFGELGVESVLLAELLEKIERRLGRALEPALLLENPTLERLGARLAALDGAGPGHADAAGADGLPPAGASEAVSSPVARAAAAAVEPRRLDARANLVEATADEGKVAVVGMACRFPGAPDLASFWENLVAGRCAVGPVPAGRWDADALCRAGQSVSRWGGFVDGLEDFDPDWFGMDDDEARATDPAIRLVLEGAAAALCDAGYAEAELRGRDVGVFMGARLSGYRRRRRGRAGVGGDQSFIAARVARHYGFHGPALVVDSACSSSLVSVQLACRSLLAGEAELALAGGVEVLLDEDPYLEFSAARALSPRGRCFAFDERADGFVPGEGCGVLLLRPLARALALGDRIHAVIDAVAVNNDGGTMGLTTPNPQAQARVVRTALARSGLRAGEIGMVEAHGTGTRIGDPIELRALAGVFRESTAGTGFCAIGSVKSNLGHLLSAAGAAGLIKAVLALEHGLIPPTLFCETPNPRFDFAASPFYPATRLREWPAAEGVRAAGVSAFGLGGTNAHLVARALDPRLRLGMPAPRAPLPPPAFRRRRCWLERDVSSVVPLPADVSSVVPLPADVSSVVPLPADVSSVVPLPADRPAAPSLLSLEFLPDAGPAPAPPACFPESPIHG